MVGPAVFAVSFVMYLIVAPSAVYWLDSPEFMAAAAGFGLPHPPGHPSMIMLLKLFMMFPVGDIPFRANLFSAFNAALVAGLTAAISRDTARSMLGAVPSWKHTSTAAGFVGVVSGLMLAGCRSAFIQASAAEVYTMNAALILGAVWTLLRAHGNADGTLDSRAGVVAGGLVGLALANHHLLAVLAIPAFVVAFVSGRKSVRGLLLSAFVAAITAAGCYLYLPVRGAAGAWPSWAATTSLPDVLWYASAKIFSGSVGGFDQSGSDPVTNVGLAFVLLADSLGPIAVVAAVGGLYLVVRMKSRRTAAVLVLLFCGSALSKIMMGILDPSNPDDHGYFLCALAVAAILAPQMLAFPVAAALTARTRPIALLGVVSAFAGVLAAVVPCRGGIETARARQVFDHTESVAETVFSAVPTGAVAMISHYPVYFVALYQQEVEGVRPDATVVQESLYYKANGGRWYAAMMAARDPSLKPLMDRFVDSGRISWPLLKDLARIRPVVVEASPDFEAPMADVTFSGWFFSVGRASSGSTDEDTTGPVGRETARGISGQPATEAALYAAHTRNRFLERARTNIETRRVVIRNLASSAEWLDRAGRKSDAELLLRAALDINPYDKTLKGRLAAAGNHKDVPADRR